MSVAVRRRSLLAVLIIALATVTSCDKMVQDGAKKRVQVILEGIQEEWGTQGGKLNIAMIQFDSGQYKREGIGEEGMYNRFIEWAEEKKIDRKFKSFAITGAETVGDATIVSVTIDKKDLKIHVKKGDRVKWVD